VSELSVVIDCRWLGYSGVGRVTELFLEGLSELAPQGRWTLWGPPTVARYRWPDATVRPAEGSPLRWAAQHDALSVPNGDVVLWLHAVRPLTKRRCVVLVHDLIPLHWSPSAPARAAWRQFMRRSCRTASNVVTYSKATRDLLINDLRIQPDAMISLPVDVVRSQRVRSMRSRDKNTSPSLLYIGQVKPHKNVPRAVQGYLSSEFCKRGGVFTIVAGAATRSGEIEEIDSLSRQTAQGRVQILGRQSDSELDQLYASATMVIQPSLEEGFGLPVVEARAAGIPVCCSDIPALREAAQGHAQLFDPTSVEAIARAIDRTASAAAGGDIPEPPDMPTPLAFAQSFVELIRQTADAGQATSASE
jgi:glycosyltransferase involved in cell wall biosynthesis